MEVVRLVGIKEAAPRLNLHPKTLQIMCREGRSPVPATLAGGGWVFRSTDIDQYINGLFDGEAAGR